MDEICSSADKSGKFYEFWTKKESFLKCIGEGFHRNSKSVDVTKDFFDDKKYIDVSGVQVFNSTNIKYGIEFCPWKEWVSMYITQDSLDNFTKEDIVAACLYEMTFFGFTDSEVQTEVKKLQESYEEMKININDK